MSNERKYLTVKDAAEYVGGVCERTIRNAIWHGHLPSVRFGRRILILREQLDDFITNNPVQNAPIENCDSE